MESIQQLIKEFYPFAKKRLGFDKDVTLYLRPDEQNAQNPLGKTAYYDPQTHNVVVYTTNRHPKDVMRSFSHELVHHAQNCRGEFDGGFVGEDGYAQNNSHLREMEREAYEQGNLCFRDWEDQRKGAMQEQEDYVTVKGNGISVDDPAGVLKGDPQIKKNIQSVDDFLTSKGYERGKGGISSYGGIKFTPRDLTHMLELIPPRSEKDNYTLIYFPRKKQEKIETKIKTPNFDNFMYNLTRFIDMLYGEDITLNEQKGAKTMNTVELREAVTSALQLFLEKQGIKNPGKYFGGEKQEAGVDDDGDGVPNDADEDPKDGSIKEVEEEQTSEETVEEEVTEENVDDKEWYNDSLFETLKKKWTK